MKLSLILVLLLPLICVGQTTSFEDTLLKKDNKLPIRPVLFEFDKSTIRAESYPYLDSIADFLVKNKTLCIEVGVHSDTRWSEKYSTCLTCKRAKAVEIYLIEKGIDPDRISSKGYNDKEPLITDAEIKKLKSLNDKEKAHQTNRRTEFKIISTDCKSEIIDLHNLSKVKSMLDGQWFRIWENDTIVERFQFFKNSYRGECKSKNYISTAPLFTLTLQDDKTIMRWQDITGGEFDCIILNLTREKMIIQCNDKKNEYYKYTL